MSREDDLEHFSESVDEMFARLGLPDPMVMAAVSSEWDRLAGPFWAGRSTPLYIRGTTLVVETASPSPNWYSLSASVNGALDSSTRSAKPEMMPTWHSCAPFTTASPACAVQPFGSVTTSWKSSPPT